MQGSHCQAWSRVTAGLWLTRRLSPLPRIGQSCQHAPLNSMRPAAQVQNSIRRTQEQLEAAKTEHASMQKQLAAATAGREDTVSIPCQLL